jgi:hypothetical protein
MTPASPTWGDIETFLTADGWRQLAAGQRGGRRQRHIFFEKLLDDGRLLQTHISHDRGATLSPGRFAAVLRDQLEVSKHEFWQAVETGHPVSRPASIDESDALELPGWIVRVLAGDLHMSAADIAELTAEEAEQLVRDYWTQQR